MREHSGGKKVDERGWEGGRKKEVGEGENLLTSLRAS